jgi:hypothetical protein
MEERGPDVIKDRSIIYRLHLPAGGRRPLFRTRP